MGDSILKQQEIAAYLGNLLSRVRKIEKKLRNDSNSALNSNSEASQDGNPLLNPYVFIPCEVTSVVGDTSVIGKEVFPDSSATTPWTIASSGQPAIEVTIPSNVSAPSLGDIILAHFTGTYGTSGSITPRYGLFGGGGGGAAMTVIQSIGDDHLVTRTIVGSTLGSTDILVAKNWKNQQTPFDGNTINGYTYVYSTSLSRKTTIAASIGFTQIEQVIPSYNVNDVIFAVETNSQVLEITVAGTLTPVTKTDLNNDNREFVRVGFAT